MGSESSLVIDDALLPQRFQEAGNILPNLRRICAVPFRESLHDLQQGAFTIAKFQHALTGALQSNDALRKKHDWILALLPPATAGSEAAPGRIERSRQSHASSSRNTPAGGPASST